jgi:hypothetical protein
MVFYASKVDLSRSKKPKTRKKIPKQAPKPVTGKAKKGAIESIGKNIKPPAKTSKPSPQIKPVKKPKTIATGEKKTIIT